MTNFNLKAYLKQLENSTSFDTCDKIPNMYLDDDTPYVFISYSHKDYKQVYADLAYLYDQRIPFRYDAELLAGTPWDKSVKKKITHPNCVGVIFYMSENLFLSNSIMKELLITLGNSQSTRGALPQKPYFCVNLTNTQPSKLIDLAFQHKQVPDPSDPIPDKTRWHDLLMYAFRNSLTYLKFHRPCHLDELIKLLEERFEITPCDDKFNFKTATFQSGNGVIAFPDGAMYEGSFQNSRFDGKGTLTTASGTVYAGDWKAGKKHGYGILQCHDGTKYEGFWADGKRNGKGKQINPDGTIYDGEWMEDLRNGMGKCTYPDDTIYDGDWKNDMRCGMGICTYPDGTFYDGDWENDMRSGTGICTYPEETYCEDEWFDSPLPIYDIRLSYDGEWMEDLPHGNGIAKYADGSRYEGLFQEGKRDGWGEIVYLDGTVYTGVWLNDQPIGNGTTTYPDGTTVDGFRVSGKTHR